MVNRKCNLSKSNSFFLFGARGTGKTSLLSNYFLENERHIIDLLVPEIEERYSSRPSQLIEDLTILKKNPSIKWIILDEIQKIPALLDLVHKLIEEKYFKFALTGSSARKLKRGHANLLAGRAFVFYLFPFTYDELGDQFDLDEYLSWGGLPKIYELNPEDRIRFLRSYAQTYLKEEILSEQLVRDLVPFRNFLEVAAQSGSKIINYSAISRDIHVQVPTTQSYFEILEDTHLGFLLKPFHESIRKRQRQNPKFYFFDVGIQRALSKKLDQKLHSGNFEYGDLFESFIIQEIRKKIFYLEKDWGLSYLRTKDNLEIDLIIDRPGLPRAFIEIKSTDRIENESLQGFKILLKTQRHFEAFVLSRDKKEFARDGIQFLHWQHGIKELGL